MDQKVDNEKESESNQTKTENDLKQTENEEDKIESELSQDELENDSKQTEKEEEEIKSNQKQEDNNERDNFLNQEEKENDQKQIEEDEKECISDHIKEKNINRYYAQVYNKEISCFYRHEIINLYRKLKIISQISNPAIINFIGYSPIDFDNNPKPLILIHYYFQSLDEELSFSSLGLMFSDNKNFISTKKLIWIYGIASGMAFLHSHNKLLIKKIEIR